MAGASTPEKSIQQVVEKIKEVCYHIDRGELDEIN